MKNNQQIKLFQPPEPDDTLPFYLDANEEKEWVKQIKALQWFDEQKMNHYINSLGIPKNKEQC